MSSNNIAINTIILLFVAFILHTTYANDDEPALNPALPRTCYSCDGIDCLRATKMNATRMCEDLLDNCVTIYRGLTVVFRGCYADLMREYRATCERQNHFECVKCYGTLCNDKGHSEFRCIECDSKVDKHCASNVSAASSVACPIPTTLNSYCYVRAANDGSTSRGCLVHQREQQECLKDQNCSMCVGDRAEACNIYKVITVQANSTSNSTANPTSNVGNSGEVVKAINIAVIIAFMLAAIALV